jgi:hypothetical protein
MVGSKPSGASRLMRLMRDLADELRRRPVEGLTVFFLVVAFALSVLWFLRDRDYVPVISALGLAAAVTGLFIVRWLEERGRRRAILRSVALELGVNVKVLDHPEFQPVTEDTAGAVVYPNLVTFAVEAALASGIFSPDRDLALIDRMREWRGRARELNDQLERFEIITSFMSEDKKYMMEQRNSVRGSPAFAIAEEGLKALFALVVEKYGQELDGELEEIRSSVLPAVGGGPGQDGG